MNELMKEFENAVKLLARAMAKEGAKLVVKRLDEKRERIADAALFVWLNKDSGDWGKTLREVSAKEILLGAAERQDCVCTASADAARALYLDHGYSEAWLRARYNNEIIGSCVAANRNHGVYVGLIEGGMRCIGCGPSYSLWEPIDPNRERTADSARYIWANQVSGDVVAALYRYSAKEIRESAAGRQVNLCKDVADAAWIAFDEGGYRLDLKCGSKERIFDLASRAKSLQVYKQGDNVELKIYSLKDGVCGGELLIRFYDAFGNEIARRARKGKVDYSAQFPFVDKFAVPGGYSHFSASVVGECCYTLETAPKAKDNTPRKLVALLSMEGQGSQGQLIAVEKIRVFDDSGPVGIESEFVKKYAKMHGIEEVTGISHSFGPGIYY